MDSWAVRQSDGGTVVTVRIAFASPLLPISNALSEALTTDEGTFCLFSMRLEAIEKRPTTSW